MKALCFIIYLLAITSVNAQLKPAILMLKTGEELKLIGKVKSNGYFKYKTMANGRFQKIHLSEVDYIEMKNAIGEEKIFRYMYVTNKKGAVLVEEVELGTKASLYAIVNNGFINQAGMITTIISIDYYIKKKGDSELTRLGEYDPIMNNLKKKVLNFFYDCDSLTSKIEQKKLKVESDMKKIIAFYNNNCN